jgi:2-polyprenyl-6-methoxyphenol hydroxylase-like FAD-dependent oxidoreductase
VLLDAVRERLGADRLLLGWHCIGFKQDGSHVELSFKDRAPVRGEIVVGCDGIHSAIRRQLYRAEGEPHYTGVNMWRGVTRWKPILSGAIMLRAGWLATGKLVHYPIRNNIDTEGRQLVNWLWEIETPSYKRWDWNRPARVEDFIAGAESWRFDWLGPTSQVVLENRRNPPDAILREISERTGDRPFGRIEEVISAQELAALSQRDKQVAGYDHETLEGGHPR